MLVFGLFAAPNQISAIVSQGAGRTLLVVVAVVQIRHWLGVRARKLALHILDRFMPKMPPQASSRTPKA